MKGKGNNEDLSPAVINGIIRARLTHTANSLGLFLHSLLILPGVAHTVAGISEDIESTNGDTEPS